MVSTRQRSWAGIWGFQWREGTPEHCPALWASRPGSGRGWKIQDLWKSRAPRFLQGKGSVEQQSPLCARSPPSSCPAPWQLHSCGRSTDRGVSWELLSSWLRAQLSQAGHLPFSWLSLDLGDIPALGDSLRTAHHRPWPCRQQLLLGLPGEGSVALPLGLWEGAGVYLEVWGVYGGFRVYLEVWGVCAGLG